MLSLEHILIFGVGAMFGGIVSLAAFLFGSLLEMRRIKRRAEKVIGKRN